MRVPAVLLAATIALLLGACGATSAESPALPTAVIIRQPVGPAVIVPTLRSTTQPPEQPSARVVLSTPTPRPEPTTPQPSVVSAPGADASAAPADPALQEALLVAEINRARAAAGLPAYLHSPELSAAARAHSCDLAAHGLISHTSSTGQTLAQRLAGATPPWEWPSENIAAGLAEPAAIVALWMDEPPDGWHRRNILDPDQREVGAGYCFAADDATGNHYYWTADFARRAG